MNLEKNSDFGELKERLDVGKFNERFWRGGIEVNKKCSEEDRERKWGRKSEKRGFKYSIVNILIVWSGINKIFHPPLYLLYLIFYAI